MKEHTAPVQADNKQEQLEWLRNAGFGMFIHWCIDSQLGSIESHSLVGGSREYADTYYRELPRTFNPKRYDPEEWVALAKLAGMKYLVFTAKHHSGFCMWDTRTTSFNVMNTPYGEDVVAKYVAACRKYGLKTGFYFSPEDFSWLHNHGKLISREFPEANPVNDPEFLEYDKAQVRELMSDYGKIDLVFFDGKGSAPLKELCWGDNPDLLITRGAISTPEQAVMGTIVDQPWEACITMGDQWSYKPGDNYKSSEKLIDILMQTRATGGTLLLNVGPKPDGEIPEEQQERLHDLALWYFLNHEAVDSVRPWIVPNEGNIWFTRKGNDLYACVTKGGIWQRTTERSFVLGTVKATDSTRITILGQSDEYIRGLPAGKKTTGVFTQEEDGLHFSITLGYQPYAGRRYDKPVVIKISNAEPSLKAPVFSTGTAEPSKGGSVKLKGELIDIGDAASVKAGFQYREEPFYGEELYAEEWKETSYTSIGTNGEFTAEAKDIKPGVNYQYRAVLKHPRVTIMGGIWVFKGM